MKYTKALVAVLTLCAVAAVVGGSIGSARADASQKRTSHSAATAKPQCPARGVSGLDLGCDVGVRHDAAQDLPVLQKHLQLAQAALHASPAPSSSKSS